MATSFEQSIPRFELDGLHSEFGGTQHGHDIVILKSAEVLENPSFPRRRESSDSCYSANRIIAVESFFPTGRITIAEH